MTTTELADSLNQFISELGSNDNSDKQIDSILATIDEALASGMGQMVIQEEASKAFGYDPNISQYIRLYLNGDRGQSNRLRGYIKQSLEGGNFTLSFGPAAPEAVGAIDVTETPHLVATDSSRIGVANADRYYPRDASGVVSSVSEGTMSDISISSERFLSEPAEIHKPLNMSELNKKLSSLPKQAQFSIVNSIANKFGTEIAYIMQNALQDGRKMNFSTALKEEVERLIEEHSEPDPQNIQISVEEDTPVSVVKTIADMPIDMAAAVVADVELCPTCGKLVAEKLADAVLTNKIELPEDIKDKEDDIAVIIENAGSSKPYPTEFSVIKSRCYNKYHRVFSELPKDLFGSLMDDNNDDDSGGGDSSDDAGDGFGGGNMRRLRRHSDDDTTEEEDTQEAEEPEEETRIKKVAKKIAKLDTKDQDKVLFDMEDKIGSKAASEVRKEAESIEEEFDLTDEDVERADEFIKATGADVEEIDEEIEEEETPSTPDEPEELDTEDTEEDILTGDGKPEEEPTLEEETELEEDDGEDSASIIKRIHANSNEEEESESDESDDDSDDDGEDDSEPEPEPDVEEEDEAEEPESEEDDEEEGNGEEDTESEDEDEGDSKSDEEITDKDIEEGFDEEEDNEDDEDDDDSVENKDFASYRFRRNFARQFSRRRMTRFSRIEKRRRLGRNFSDRIADNTEIDRYADQYCARKPEVAKGEFVDLLRAKAKCLKSGSDKDCQTYEKLKGNFNMKYGYKPKDGWVGRRGSKSRHFSRHAFNFTQALDLLDPEKASAVLTIVGKQCGNVVSDAILAMSLTNHSKSKHFSDIADDMLPAGSDQDEIQEVLQDSIEEVSDVEEPIELFSGIDRIEYLKNLSLFSCALYSDEEDEIDTGIEDIDTDIDDIDVDIDDIDADIDAIDEDVDEMEFARRRSRFGRSRSRSRFGRGRGSFRMFADKDEDDADEKPAKKEEKKSECKGEDCEGCPECDPDKAEKADKDEKKAEGKDKKEEKSEPKKAEPKKAEKKADKEDADDADDAEPVSLSAIDEEEIDIISDGAETDYVEDTTAMPDVPYVADADDEDALPLPEGDYIDDEGDPADSDDDGILPFESLPADIDDDDDTVITDEEIEANFSKSSMNSESGVKKGIDLYDYILGGAKQK